MTNKHAALRINLADTLAPTISTRVAIQAFTNRLRALPASDIVLDFSQVESISRSAAHELVITRFELTNVDHKHIAFENMNPSVTTLFATVTDNAINAKRKDRDVTTKQIAFKKLHTLAF